jgi:hypothetical protein
MVFGNGTTFAFRRAAADALPVFGLVTIPSSCFHGLLFLNLQDVFDGAVGEFAFHGSV